MRRGELAAHSGCNVETVRFYEKRGLLPAPPRTAGGHRDYDIEHLKRLTFIRRSRELGFTLDEIRGLLALVDGRAYSCAEVKALTLGHLQDVRQKIADLAKLDRVLSELVERCQDDHIPDCPIIDALFETPVPGPVAAARRPGSRQ